MFSGSGPGAQSVDGCSVELYRRLTHFTDLEVVRAFLSPGATVLELGCGAGRHTRALLQWGLVPTCVDASPEMLVHLPVEAAAVLSPIESLALDRQFDVALLASCLVNHPNPVLRRQFVGTAAKHLKAGAVFLVERHDPRWLRSAEAGWVGQAEAATIALQSVERQGSVSQMALRYSTRDGEWVHHFAAEALDQQQVELVLSEAGLHSFSWLGPSLTWVAARS